MLVLSRRIEESIQIGDTITVTVLEIQGGKVRLGITAPTTVAVHRKELLEEVDSELGGEAGGA